ncbi:MAG: 4Fe-4S dicluster domain-containing protein, partial [Dehalococcoidia bacterium]|nr:4Fe-4S dicluster domain-containing protein [Dehalococcoidia bacterium]
PLPFVEDTAVDPESLPEFVRRFDEIVREAGTEAGYYGHASVGCLHIRPLVDLRRQTGVDRMVAIAEAVSDLVLEFGGALSGEHGDGLVRSPFIEKMFGPTILEAFGRVKMAFDPDGIMNPGKIVDPPGLVDNLRIDPDYRTVDTPTAISFNREGGLAAAIEMCNGQGACRKPAGGTMCPSFMATRDEEHSTRGRANALRSAISGAIPVESITGERIGRVMDLCLGCKACKAECPSNVDMAKLKYEVAARCRSERGPTLRERAFGNIDRLGSLGSLLAPVSNWVLGSEAVGELLENLAGIDRRRTLPPYAGQTFRQWMRARDPQAHGSAPRGRVVLFADTFTNYHHPEIGRAAVVVLEALGYQVEVPEFRCCGRPQLSVGDVERARRNAAANVEIASSAMADGAKLVGLEPSCVLAFGDEYLYLLEGDETARRVASDSLLIDEFLSDALGGRNVEFTDGGSARTLLHGHCQQRALVGTGHSLDVLRMLPGPGPAEIDSGCCGMAGSFGFESEHYEMSMAIGELSLFPEIREQSGEFELVSLGISCRQQIMDGTGVRARHLVEVVAESLAGSMSLKG